MARLAKVTGGRDRETFSLALTSHFASIFPRVFKYAIYLFQVLLDFPSCTGPAQGNWLLLVDLAIHVFGRALAFVRKCTLASFLCVSCLCTLQFSMAVSRFPLPAHLHDVSDSGSSPIKKITHFLHGSGASLFNAKDPFLRVAMSLEQAHQRLGIAAGVI